MIDAPKKHIFYFFSDGWLFCPLFYLNRHHLTLRERDTLHSPCPSKLGGNLSSIRFLSLSLSLPRKMRSIFTRGVKMGTKDPEVCSIQCVKTRRGYTKVERERQPQGEEEFEENWMEEEDTQMTRSEKVMERGRLESADRRRRKGRRTFLEGRSKKVRIRRWGDVCPEDPIFFSFTSLLLTSSLSHTLCVHL